MTKIIQVVVCNKVVWSIFLFISKEYITSFRQLNSDKWFWLSRIGDSWFVDTEYAMGFIAKTLIFDSWFPEETGPSSLWFYFSNIAIILVSSASIRCWDVWIRSWDARRLFFISCISFSILPTQVSSSRVSNSPNFADHDPEANW